MTDDHQQLDVIDDAFAGFRDGGPLGVPLGADAVRGTVRYRRKVRTVTGIAIVAVAIITPAGLYATGVFDSGKAPQVGASTTQAGTGSPAVAETGGPSATASAPGSPADGRIADPANATLPLPAWPTFVQGAKPCATGSTKFSKSKHTASGQSDVEILKTAYLDLDADGAQETVALFKCAVNSLGYRMVVAYGKDGAGTVVQLGKVVQNSATGIKTIDDLRASGTAVEAHVSDDPAATATSTQWQWRAYAWNGSAFIQTGGLSTFPSNAPDPHLTKFTVATAQSDITFTTVNGRLEGTFTFTIRNDGPVATSEGRITINGTGLGDWSTSNANAMCGYRTGGSGPIVCPLTIGVGETQTITYKFIIENATASTPDDKLVIAVDTAAARNAQQGYQAAVSVQVPAKVA
jgi:hypothetical protein